MSSTLNTLEVHKNQANRFDHIDGLRALAVMLVVCMHAGYTFIPGDSGVTVFFTISGFIITHILLREREKTGSFDARSFYFRRGFKLAPPFIVAIIIPTLFYWVNHTIDLSAFLGQIFFSYNWVEIFNSQGGQVLPGSGVVWSLAIEEQFYIVFSLIWLVIVRVFWWRRALLILSISAIIGSTLIRTVLAQDDQIIRVLRGTDTRLDAIAWGILASVLVFMWQRGQASWLSAIGKDWALWAALILFLGGMALRDGWMEYAFRPTLQALAGGLVIVYGMVPTETRLKVLFYRSMAWAPLQSVGLASYSIYLVHYSLEKVLSPILIGLPQLAYVTIVTAVGVIVGILLYRAVEVPALAWRKKIEQRSRKGQRGRRAAR